MSSNGLGDIFKEAPFIDVRRRGLAAINQAVSLGRSDVIQKHCYGSNRPQVPGLEGCLVSATTSDQTDILLMLLGHRDCRFPVIGGKETSVDRELSEIVAKDYGREVPVSVQLLRDKEALHWFVEMSKILNPVFYNVQKNVISNPGSVICLSVISRGKELGGRIRVENGTKKQHPRGSHYDSEQNGLHHQVACFLAHALVHCGCKKVVSAVETYRYRDLVSFDPKNLDAALFSSLVTDYLLDLSKVGRDFQKECHQARQIQVALAPSLAGKNPWTASYYLVDSQTLVFPLPDSEKLQFAAVTHNNDLVKASVNLRNGTQRSASAFQLIPSELFIPGSLIPTVLVGSEKQLREVIEKKMAPPTWREWIFGR